MTPRQPLGQYLQYGVEKSAEFPTGRLRAAETSITSRFPIPTITTKGKEVLYRRVVGKIYGEQVRFDTVNTTLRNVQDSLQNLENQVG